MQRNVNILLILSTVQKARRDKLSGIYDYARRHGWNTETVEPHPFARPVSDILAEHHIDGIIIDGHEACCKLPRNLKGRPPVVRIDAPPRSASALKCVNHDSAATAQLAAKTLLKSGFRHYAFLGTNPSIYWSIDRCHDFAAEIAAAGFKCYVFNGKEDALDGWLASLPKPCGLFAAMDLRAKTVADKCRKLGIRIPDEIAVLGVDNDEQLCESTYPALSSILPDFRHAGELAAALLDRTLRGEDTSAETILYGPLCVVTRESTRFMKVNLSGVSRANEFIRRNSCAGIKVADVVKAVAMPRRTLETHFFRSTGHTILDEILRTKLDKVREILSTTTRPIGLIASSCGFNSDIHLKNLFKKRFGMSMRDYRKNARCIQKASKTTTPMPNRRPCVVLSNLTS